MDVSLSAHAVRLPSSIRYTNITYKAEELSFKNGDFAISIFDLDLDQAKVVQLNQAKSLASAKRILLITSTSNPCFEIWYLEHFVPLIIIVISQ